MSQTDPDGDTDTDPYGWENYFPYDKAYDDQRDGIESAVDVARRNGFLLLEGACGTGKTLLSLAAGLSLVRDPTSSYKRVLVLTSVKQQTKQFETDLAEINSSLPDSDAVDSVTLVGKSDVCPYSREGIIEDGLYSKCEDLRDETRRRIYSSSRDSETAGGDNVSKAISNAGQIMTQHEARVESAGAPTLETAGVESPYSEEVDDVCPFYARYVADTVDDDAEVLQHDGVLTPKRLVAEGVEKGTCPHSAMGEILDEAEVVVGNYQHAFDPVTVEAFTREIIDSSTLVVCDEAHTLVNKVREQLSSSVSYTHIERAENEIDDVISMVSDESPRQDSEILQADTDLAGTILDENDVSVSDLRKARTFLRDLRAEIDSVVTSHLDSEIGGWRNVISDLTVTGDEYEYEIPLRSPEKPDEVDEITRSLDSYDEGDWMTVGRVGWVVGGVLDNVYESHDFDSMRAAPVVGNLVQSWYANGTGEYFRQLELSPRDYVWRQPSQDWRQVYKGSLVLRNCIPSEEIRDRLTEFGGGVLMSATLEPIDVFRHEIGFDSEGFDRDIEEKTYGLDFPEENRESLAVRTPKFKHSNRGPRFVDGEPNTDTDARRACVRTTVDVVSNTPGNVMVGTPSYAEADWMAEVLRDRDDIDAEILVDESTDDETTQRLKSRFFRGDDKVLVTSVLGTLTEGVDYEGDKLRGIVVCGVPLADTSGDYSEAVETAYGRRFGDDSAYDYAYTVPAVRKVRQAVGRVIRGDDEVGIRVICDERYTEEHLWDSVREYFPEYERDEFKPVSPDMVDLGVKRFWDSHEK